MHNENCSVSLPMPYFAEAPHYLWGQINYDSEGDCDRPTDRTWTWLYLANRDTGEEVSIQRVEENCTISSESVHACTKVAMFLKQRTLDESPAKSAANAPGTWDHSRAMRRADMIAEEFQRDELKSFDSHLFWGSWKWIGWFGTEFTWIGRWIMHSVVRKDARAVNLCIEWLRDGTVSDQQSAALRYALHELTGEDFARDARWLKWYDKAGGREQYPEPDFNEWHAEMQAEFDPFLVLGESKT